MKITKFLIVTLFAFLFTGGLYTQTAFSQPALFTKKDSIKALDSISTINPAGQYEKGAFTLRSTAVGDTLKPQVRYGTSSEWVTTSVKNLRTLASDTNIVLTASSWPVDFEINNPCIVGFRLISIPGMVATRRTLINYRLWRHEN